MPDAAYLAVGKLATTVKSSSVFLGILYLFSFLLLLPIFLRQQNVLTGAEVLFIAMLAVIAVHLLLNWLYVLTIAVPIIMSAVFFLGGMMIYLFAPLVILPIEALTHWIPMAGESIAGSLSYIHEFITRFGQTLMILGGGLWFLVKRAENINYIALATFLIGLTALGIIAGLTSLSGLLVFLTVWATVYMKIKGDKLKDDNNLPDLQILFKVVATITVLIGFFKISIVQSGSDFLNTAFYFSNSGNVFSSEGYGAFLKVYESILGIFFLFGIWKPELLVKYVPDKLKDIAVNASNALVNIRNIR